MIYVADLVGFDSKNACALMVKNVKGKGVELGITAEGLFLNRDKIQQLQINWLISNLEQFIQKMDK
ncbi:MAG: hypothetical protein HFE73_01160 [Firmicutes bacterium]|nr:hypothetical protein [Bacillota bacterium]